MLCRTQGFQPDLALMHRVDAFVGQREVLGIWLNFVLGSIMTDQGGKERTKICAGRTTKSTMHAGWL